MKESVSVLKLEGRKWRKKLFERDKAYVVLQNHEFGLDGVKPQYGQGHQSDRKESISFFYIFFLSQPFQFNKLIL